MLTKALTGELTFTSLKPCDLATCTKDDIKAYFENSYNLNESLFTGFKDDSVFYKCPDRLRLPLIFYYGHTACVYINKLILSGLLAPEDRVNLELETIFETGVDEMSWDDTENFRMGGKFRWPNLDDVVEYRSIVRKMILDIIDDTPLTLPITMESPWWGLFMGMEHERIHIETSSVLIRQLPVGYLSVPDGWVYGPTKHAEGAGENKLVPVNKTKVTLGKPKDFPSFGWDNEYGHLESTVPAFEASKYMVTNQEFLAFVQAGGYENKKYWSEEGWNWVNYRQAKHPTFWVCTNGCKSGCGAALSSYSHCQAEISDRLNGNDEENSCELDVEVGKVHSESRSEKKSETVNLNGHQGKDEEGGLEFGFRLRCMYSVIDMPREWPVEVNYLEAKAFCAWKGAEYRLPCEAEHNVIRGTQKPLNEGTNCDIIYENNILANINLQYGSSTPVNMYPPNDSGFYDVFGNAWEWMEDHFNGLPGYDSIYLYDDFSAPCFDGRHNLILGGSWISTGDEASRFARFAFRRHFFQHAGFRIVRNASVSKKVNVPIRLCTNKIYVSGSGVQDNPVQLNTKTVGYIPVDSTFSQYHYEQEDVLNETLKWEYATKQPFTLTLSAMVKNLVEKYNCNTSSALHLGCGTGRATFPLADTFDQVLGQDFCARYIDTCNELLRGEHVDFIEFDGFKKNKLVAFMPQETKAEKIVFKQLTWLPNEIRFHDLVLLTSLDRVQNPKAWLVRLREVVKKNGLLIVASSGPWNEESLTPELKNHFKLLEVENIPVNDSTINSRVSVWKREA